ncbi:MAG: hypothetical protein ACI3VA_05800 [Candidatus Limivicinus sp.]
MTSAERREGRYQRRRAARLQRKLERKKAAEMNKGKDAIQQTKLPNEPEK